MSKQHKVELARTLCASDSPMNKSQLASVLGIARSSLYVQGKRPKLDKALAVRIEEAHGRHDGASEVGRAAWDWEESRQASDAQVRDRCPAQTPEIRVSWQSDADRAQ